jgi:outer membrane protein, heavy metal efflux system
MFCVIMVVVYSIIFAGPALALTLEEAVATGLYNNPDIQAFRFEEEVARGQVRRAQLPPLSNPVIEGSYSSQDRPSGEPGGAFNNHRITLSQGVEIGGQRGLRINAATNTLERSRLDIRDFERRLKADIKDGFAEALFLRDRETLMEEYLRIQQELSGLVSLKYEAGDVAALEVNLSQVELARAQKEVIAASTVYRNSLVSLKRLIGLPADAAMAVDGELAAGFPPLPERQTLLAGVPGRPDIKAAQAEITRLEAVERLVRREIIPNLTLSVFTGKTEGGDETGGVLGISIPLFDRKQGERIEARARVSQARIQELALTRTAQKEIDASYAAAAASLRELGIFRKGILERLTENLDLLQFAFKEGKISFYDVRVAQRETFDTRNAYLQALITAQRAFNAIERATGGALR